MTTPNFQPGKIVMCGNRRVMIVEGETLTQYPYRNMSEGKKHAAHPVGEIKSSAKACFQSVEQYMRGRERGRRVNGVAPARIRGMA